MTNSAGRPGETEAVEAAYLAVSAYTPEQAVRWQNTANGIMYRREAENAVRAAYPIIAEAVRAETADEVRALGDRRDWAASKRLYDKWVACFVAAREAEAERDSARAELAAARDQIAAVRAETHLDDDLPILAPDGMTDQWVEGWDYAIDEMWRRVRAALSQSGQPTKGEPA